MPKIAESFIRLSTVITLNTTASKLLQPLVNRGRNIYISLVTGGTKDHSTSSGTAWFHWLHIDTSLPALIFSYFSLAMGGYQAVANCSSVALLLFCGQLCNRCLRQKKNHNNKTNQHKYDKKEKEMTKATKKDMRFITVHTRVVSSLRKFNRDVLLKGSLIQVQCRPDSLYNLKMTYLRLQPLCSQWYCVQFTSVANFLCPSVGLHLAVINVDINSREKEACH